VQQNSNQVIQVKLYVLISPNFLQLQSSNLLK